MPENDPQDQTDLPGESTNHGTGDSAVPSDQGADSADSAGALPTPESLPADSVDLDPSLSKIDQLSQALAKLSQASADDGFADKMRQLTREASEAQDKAGDQPRSEAPTEQSQEPVEPTLPTQPSDEQLSASEPDETAPAETVLDAADIGPLHEAFDPSPLDDIVADLADDGFDVTSEAGWESTDEEAPSDAAPVQAGADDAPGFEFEAPESSFDVAVPPQPLAEDIWETEESDSPEAVTTEHQSDDPPIGGQQSSSVADTLQNEHEAISDSADEDGREALGWASESDSEEEEKSSARRWSRSTRSRSRLN